MVASSPGTFLLLLLVGTSSAAQTCPPPGEGEDRCIELTADKVDEVSEVQVSAGQTTTFLFDSDVREGGITLEGREQFKVVEPGRRIFTIVPSERTRGEKPSTVTVCFSDGAAPECATFRLVVHPAIAERQVNVFRHPRPVDSVQSELMKTRKESARLRAELAQLRAERDRPEGLTGLFASGMVGSTGIPFQPLTKSITERESNTLHPMAVTTFRAPDRVAMELMLENPEGAKPWTPRGAVLVGPKGKVLEATVWPSEPIPSGKWRHVWIEVMAPEERTAGTFILKLWEEDGQRTFVIGNVTFPALPEAPRH